MAYGQGLSGMPKIYALGCDRGEAASCYKLGMLFENGSMGVKRDKSIAKQLYAQACNMGYRDGCKQYRFLNSRGY